MRKNMYVLFTFMLVLFLAACGGNQESNSEKNNGQKQNEQNEKNVEQTKQQKAEEKVIDLLNDKGKKVGTAELEPSTDGVIVNLEASDLPPGTHGFHFHETGKCEAPSFESAGGHFNPSQKEHGLENKKGTHAGDLPNIVVDKKGYVEAVFTAKGVTLTKDKENSLLKEEGTALVIHEKADDGKSQPSGNAGDRLVCGEIR